MNTKIGHGSNPKEKELAPKEIERRFTAAIARALNTPHKPHKPIKKGAAKFPKKERQAKER